MSNFDDGYQEMVTAAEAALAAWVGPPSIKIEYDNRQLVDSERDLTPYVCVEYHFISGEQLSIGKTKDVADYGQIHVIAHAPEGAGTLILQRLLAHFRPYLELKDFSVLRTHSAMQGERYDKAGWYCLPLVVPFWTVRLVTS